MHMRWGWLGALMLCCCNAYAQGVADEADDGWYDIELLVFANRDPAAALEERWEPLPNLVYPERWRRISTGSALSNPEPRLTLLRLEDTLPEPQIDLFWDTPVETLLQQWRLSQGLRKPVYTLEPLLDIRVPRPHVLLPEAGRDFNAQRKRIDRSGDLDVLWHGYWRQRIPDQSASIPLLIESDNRRGDFPELQGSLLFYSGRYLHIVTNLWLNTEGDYLDNERATTGWRMPPPPLPPAEVETRLPLFQVNPETYWLSGYDADVAEAATAAPLPAIGTDPDMPNPAETPLDQNALAIADMMASFNARPMVDYPYRHAVQLQQQRRMRSGELHYIDHPLLGIVVRVSPTAFLPFVSPEGRPLPADRP